jgi:hypothetical protein
MKQVEPETAAKMIGREADVLGVKIDGLDPNQLHATLVSTIGNHCEVWRTSRRLIHQQEQEAYLEFVIKRPLLENNPREIRILARHYRQMKEALQDMIPEALFFITRIDGESNVCVLARAVNIWFNIANPQNREEAVELLRNYPKARLQLQHFVEVAEGWRHSDNPRVIDLYGLDNLVMDNNREIRYLDSFYVFFFPDMLEFLDEPDPQLAAKLEVSLARLAYLNELLALSA